ncbi:DUF6515 family protein [Coraliomargarita sp. SDUM461004]|uniref:DUF6515 family protein n=1 Tax=Thalassobacterium sedimentorum TaxID=3041258 RepID=A0ABU1AQG1_9BACT|nr:DUF6515 family protein [Coraliomargarita sp. SDUM461004]MDQ8195833.1 DUF6515 family protein [Coraliomargarita sp. SDUM461004]
MKIHPLSKYASLVGLSVLTAASPVSLSAAKHHAPQPHAAAKGPGSSHGPVIGAFVGIQPPSGSISIQVGNFSFRYNNGVYYKHTKHGYVVTKAPRGAVIHSLPPGHTRVVNKGYVYYCYNNVYYRQAPNGYIVVEPPVTIVQQSPVVATATAPVTPECSVWLGEQELLLRGGQFFRNTPEGLVWVEMPLGALTKTLPEDASVIWHQDIEYFDVDGVLFRKTPDGYKVVPVPWS